jgi:tRNA(Ile)-lysidine synthase
VTGGVEAAARAALDRRLDPESAAPLAVAVSGGGDSIALMHLAADWAAGAARPLRVLTVDHGLNRESGAWAQGVVDAAARLALSAEVLRWTGPKPAAGLPAAARAARHARLAEAARAAGARVILMGHTADDLVESAAMRAGGASVGDPREWGPSPAWPEGRGVFLLRPLLALSRRSLREHLRGLGEAWTEDPANADLRFARARARAGAVGALDGGAGGMTPAPPPLLAEETPWGGLSWPAGERLEGRALSAAVLCASGGTEPPRGVGLARLALRLERGEGATLAGARIAPAAGSILFGRDPGRRACPRWPRSPGASGSGTVGSRFRSKSRGRWGPSPGARRASPTPSGRR